MGFSHPVHTSRARHYFTGHAAGGTEADTGWTHRPRRRLDIHVNRNGNLSSAIERHLLEAGAGSPASGVVLELAPIDGSRIEGKAPRQVALDECRRIATRADWQFLPVDADE